MKVFISALGMMGRRHLLGAMQAGAEVVAFDPSPESIQKAKDAITAGGLDLAKAQFVTSLPQGEKYDAAIFAETADYRKNNFLKFVETNKAGKILLEKPLSQNVSDLNLFFELSERLEQAGTPVYVNFPRRAWPFYMALKEKLKGEKFVEMTLNGGAVGIGCNGIHYLDMFSYLVQDMPGDMQVVLSKVSDTLVGSGRGERFKDYGGHFLLQKGQSSFYICANPESSTTPILTIKTALTTMWVDENNYTFRQWDKTAGFEKPTYLYGQDYAISQEGNVQYRDLISLTKEWLNGATSLPHLSQSRESHMSLFNLLQTAKVSEPYLFT